MSNTITDSAAANLFVCYFILFYHLSATSVNMECVLFVDLKNKNLIHL